MSILMFWLYFEHITEMNGEKVTDFSLYLKALSASFVHVGNKDTGIYFKKSVSKKSIIKSFSEIPGARNLAQRF